MQPIAHSSKRMVEYDMKKYFTEEKASSVMGVQPGKTLQWFIVSSVEINTETVETTGITPKPKHREMLFLHC